MYDVSKFADQHPGGSVIGTYFGRDGTDVFSTFHAATTWKLLQTFYIGDLLVSGLLCDVDRIAHDRQFESRFYPELVLSTPAFSSIESLLH